MPKKARTPQPYHPNHGFVNLAFPPYKTVDKPGQVGVVFQSGVYRMVLASDIITK